MATHPLAEIFGFPYQDLSSQATRYRTHKLCPYNNKVPSCTKNSVTHPLGVCSVFENDRPVITCPIRFRQDWTIIDDAAAFFFPSHTPFTSVSEIRLNDAHRETAGNIDFVLVSFDDHGNITDFGALEVQAVYISGNVSKPFQSYIKTYHTQTDFHWKESVRPDYLSSSRKRLVPQLLYKGRILRAWQKKIAVALQDSFYATLPELPAVPPQEADIAWIIYTLEIHPTTQTYHLTHKQTVYTQFQAALETMTTPQVGDVHDFIQVLQKKLEEQEGMYPPVNMTLLETPSEGEETRI
jgi:hypothetical protein